MLSAAAAPFPWSTWLTLALRHVPCGTGVPLPAAPTQLLLWWERPWGRLGTSTGCNHHHHHHHHLARFQGSSISPKRDVQSENISLRLGSSKNMGFFICFCCCFIWFCFPLNKIPLSWKCKVCVTSRQRQIFILVVSKKQNGTALFGKSEETK